MIPDEDLERRREKDGMPWREDNDPDRGPPRGANRGPTCRERLVIDYEEA